MKKYFLSLAVFVMALCANAQTNQYFWYQGNLMMGNPIAQIDSVTFGEGEPADTLYILLPRTIIKTVRETVYVTIHDTVCPNTIPEGALAGEFSVSTTKKVRFSKGNLQFNAAQGTHQCADGTIKQGTWQFAEHQWDMIGNRNVNISSSYNGWIDLFGWGTSGWNSGANAYQPYSTSRYEGDYFPEGDYRNNLTGECANADWGIYNSISNGGNVFGTWRTLTNDEWSYILVSRDNANTLYGQATVNGVHGLIILPDGWTPILGIEFIPAYSSTGWTVNTYTESQWTQMENVGAVFLPAGCGRRGQNIEYNNVGSYWSSTIDEWSDAKDISFFMDHINTNDDAGRDNGQSVRLVQDVE